MALISPGGGGGSSGTSILFNQTLGASATSIDTGAGAIVGGFAVLLVSCTYRTDEALINSIPLVTVNGDTGGNYDREVSRALNVTASAAPATAGTSWQFTGHGNLGLANQASAMLLWIPNYTGTTFNKEGVLWAPCTDSTGANTSMETWSVGWRNTAAITALKIQAPGANNLLAGSRLTIHAM